MIHLEPLHQSPFLRIDLVRIYLDIPQSQDAFHSRLDYDYICVVVTRPKARQTEVKGLKAHSRGCSKKVLIELFDQLYIQRDTTQVHYERASGKAPRLYRHGPARWRPFKTPAASPAVDIKMISV